MATQPRNPASLTADDNLVLRQVQGSRRDVAAVLDNQVRQQDLIARLSRHVDEGFTQVALDIVEMKSDIVLLENKLLSRHNELLRVMRRLDEAGAPPLEEHETSDRATDDDRSPG